METTQTLFLNFHPLVGFSVDTHVGGRHSDSIIGFMADLSIYAPACIALDNAKNGLSMDLHDTPLNELMPDYEIDILADSIRDEINAH